MAHLANSTNANETQTQGTVSFTSHFGLPLAPVFFPTSEEYKNPWNYLNSIRAQVSKTGIAVIQPPSGAWDFDSFNKNIDATKFTFITKAQNIHQMQRRDGPNVSFVLALRKYWKIHGQPLDTLPDIFGVLLDMYKLKNQMAVHGGFEKVEANNAWESIARSLRLLAPSDTRENVLLACEKLKASYLQILHPYLLHVEQTALQQRDNNNTPDLKRKAETQPEEDQAQKKQKLETTSGDPLWMEVKSRSFAKDANDAPDSRCLTRFHGAPKMGKMMSGQPVNVVDKNSAEAEDDPETLRVHFGYHEGRRYTLEEFKQMASRFEETWWDCTTIAQKEATYWDIIEKGEEFIQVYYGSDLDVAQHGSGFPLPDERKGKRSKQFRNSTKGSDYMKQSGWNINNLANATFLHHINEAVAGVTRPMMYVGMLFTNFCWHTEDNYLYSVNYVHAGQPKLWYGIPGSAADQFELAMQNKLPELFQRNPNLLHLLITQLSPQALTEAGVPVYTAIQKPGQFVVTCPRSYHAGFNTGFNVAESVNFALEDWLPFCRQACANYRYKRSPIFPYEEFVLKAATTPDTPEIGRILQEEVKDIIQQERLLQRTVNKEGITQFISLGTCDYQPCHDCGYDCYLSGITCNNHPGKISCLSHAKNLCDCPMSFKRLLVRVHLMELKQVQDKLTEKVKEMEKKEEQSSMDWT